MVPGGFCCDDFITGLHEFLVLETVGGDIGILTWVAHEAQERCFISPKGVDHRHLRGILVPCPPCHPAPQ